MAMEAKLLPLVAPVGSRYQSLSVDSRLVNTIAEKGSQEGEVFLYRRPAFVEFQTLDAGGGTARGLHNWNGNIYAVVDDTVYKNGVAIAGTVNASGNYSFTQTLGASPRLFLKNGTNAYTITTGDVLAAVADADYPASTTGGAAYLDGTVFVMKPDTAGIYGSDAAANDATSWDPLNLILAQIEPTQGVHLAKHLTYLLAMKESYTEAFYDAGNPTGSVLSPVQGAKMNYGCVDSRTVRDLGGDLMWVADTGEGFWSAVFVSGLKLEVVSTPPIERLLSGGSVGNFMSWNARIEGHRLYGVTNTVGNWTLVFDVTSGMWYQWAHHDGNYLPYSHSCKGSGSTTLFLHSTNGKLYTLSTTSYIDSASSGAAFSMDVYTPNYDGGTRRSKTLQRVCLIGDQVNTTVSLAYSDDDYASWVSGFTVNMSLDQPVIDGLGSFTKRAFRISHAANAAFRLKGVEMYIDVGT